MSNIWCFCWCSFRSVGRSAVTCGAVTTGDNVPLLGNGTYSPQKESYQHSEVVKYSCQQGFTFRGWKSASCSLDGTFKGSPPTCDGDFHNPWDLFLLYPLQWFIICNIIPNWNGGRITNRALHRWFIMIVFIGDRVSFYEHGSTRGLCSVGASQVPVILWLCDTCILLQQHVNCSAFSSSQVIGPVPLPVPYREWFLAV